jgi:hypothetical protein
MCFMNWQYECREFRESVLGAMPHHWVRLDACYLLVQLLYFGYF